MDFQNIFDCFISPYIFRKSNNYGEELLIFDFLIKIFESSRMISFIQVDRKCIEITDYLRRISVRSFPLFDVCISGIITVKSDYGG